MLHHLSPRKHPELAVGLLCLTVVLGCFIFTSRASSQSARLAQDLDSQFLQHQTVTLDAAAAASQVRATGHLSLVTSDASFDLELTPHDMRGVGYRAEEVGADGVTRTIDTGPVRTFKGQVQGGGQARLTIDGSVVEGMIITPQERYYVEPASRYSKSAKTTDYVMYAESDVLASSSGECGVTMNEQVNQRVEGLGALKLKEGSLIAPGVSAATTSLQELRIATEADNEYVISKGGAAAADQAILSIINQVEGLYEIELGLSIKVVYQSAWSSANDPYSSTNPSALLGELTDYWNSNRGSVARDVVHMWTGKNLDNATIGTAYLEALCRFVGNGRAAYGLSKGVSGVQQIAITAHEIGHNLGATHPNQQVPPVAECNNKVMSSSVSTNPQLDFCQYSVNEIAKYVATSPGCLSGGTSQLSFATGLNFPAGSFPTSIAQGDFDNDGKPDLVTANADGGSVSVLLGRGDGSLQPPVNYPTGADPNCTSNNSVAVSDFNGDVKLDLVTANSSCIDFSGSVHVLLGKGDGSFQLAASYPVGLSPMSVIAGDFNSDGKHDLAVVNSDSNTLSVLLGTGTGSFQAAVNYPVGPGPWSVAVGDFNGDGKLDLVTASSGLVNVLLGRGDGSFQMAVNYLTSSDPFAVTVGDFNGDNKLDLATVNDGSVSVLLGRGDGSLQPAANSAVGSSSFSSVASGDINGDGKLDLVTTNRDQSTVNVLLGTGDGGFQTAVNYAVGLSPVVVVVGDFNGGGELDLVTANYGDSTVSMLLGKGDGSFQTAAQSHISGAFAESVAVGDFNGDGKLDLATANLGSPIGGVSALLGRGDGSFQSAVDYPADTGAFGPISIVAADFNGDNKLDLVTENQMGSVIVLLGRGDGSFQPATSYRTDSGSIAIALGDFNRDGKLDIATANYNANNLSILLGTGTGSFQPAVNYPAGSGPRSVAVSDFNGDGKLDLATANTSARNVSVLLGRGDGSFQLPASYDVGVNPGSIAMSDFNGDGKQDLAVANSGSNNVSVLLGRGDGSFQLATNYPVGLSPLAISTGDFNGDGKLDLVTANFGGSVSVLLGKGEGGFQPALNYFAGGILFSVAVGDFNGDGRQDLVAGGSAIQVLLNTSGQPPSPPFNDDFLAAPIIGGPTGSILGNNFFATKEPGEPNHASGSNGTGGASIWYRWTAPSTGKFYFQTYSSNFNTVLAVYTGSSVGALTLVVKSTSSVPEYVEFNATVGTTYRIAIDSLTGDTGRTVLNWNPESLTNDNFAFGREIRGSNGSVNGDNTNFTLETNEPTLPGASGTGFSAWYRWTAPNTGKVSFFTTPCGDTTRLLGAYTGNFIDILSQVAVNYDGYRDVDDPTTCDNRSLRFNAVAGTSYRIQMRSVAGKPFTLNWNYANPPPNDNFANALILSGSSGSVVGTNRDATKEPGEPNHAGGIGGASVWYRWTAPSSGQVTFDTIGFRNQSSNSFRYLTALMAVYTGSSLNALTSVVTSSSGNKVTFNATAGTTYQIAVDSAPYAGGGFLPGIVPLHWGTKQISNDDFANAQALSASGSFSPLLGTNVGATKETGEPNHQGNVGGTSVWYRWTALSNGNASFVFNPCSTCSLSAGNALVAIYTGGNVSALNPVSTSPDSDHTFSSVRGTTYFIAVDSNTGAGGTYEFSLVSSSISARNDAYVNAQVLSGTAGAVAGDNSGASKEIGEPNHANDIGGTSVWYRWTAPASGLYTFDTFGSNFDTLLGVYTGNAVSALSTVASSDNAGVSAQSRVTFNAIVNTTYYIAIDGKSTGIDQGTGLPRSQTGFIMLSWSNLPPPVNDNFASAQVITGLAGNTTGRNTVASKEGGEPNHAGNPGGVSVWCQWTAPSNGNVTFNTFGSDFNTLLGVYTGNAVNALTQVSSNDDVGGLSQSSVTFNAVSGTVYYIAVDGSVGVPGSVTSFTGNVVLSWSPQAGISNDSFAQAQTLTGNSGSLASTNVGATKENGEPNHAGDRGGRSVWYSWTALFNGPVLFTTLGSDFDTLLGVYTGASVNGLTLVASNDDTPYGDNLKNHGLTSSLTFTAVAGTTYKIAADGSGGRSGNLALRWGPEASISGQVFFNSGFCGSNKNVSVILSGEDERAVTFNGSGTYTFQHLRAGGNYSVRGVSEITASCIPFFLERAQNYFPLAGDVVNRNFLDDGLRGGGSTSNISGQVKDAGGLGLSNVAVALSGTASRTVYTDSAGSYLLPDLPVGTYQVVPAKAGTIFTPAVRSFTFTSNKTITEADFAMPETFTISGQTTDSNGAALGGVTVTINDGTQSTPVQTAGDGYYSFNAVAGGSYTITAAKAGITFTQPTLPFPTLSANQKNADFKASTTTKADQTLTFGALANKTFGDAPFNVSATASSGLAVSFQILSGPASISGNTVTLAGAGAVTVRASQPGDSNFNAAANVDQSFAIAPATTSTAVTSSANPSGVNQSVTFTATATSGAGTPNGTVQFKDNGANLGAPQPVNGSGVATFATSALTAGSHTITADYSGDVNFAVSTGTLPGGQVVNNQALISFSQSGYSVAEGGGFLTITVNRSGINSSAATIDYATSDGTVSLLPCSTANGLASSRCDFTTALGTLNFAAGETSKTFVVLVTPDSYIEGPETFTVILSNATGGAVSTSPSSATITINDDPTQPSTNPIDGAPYYVRQHYHDFLNREPDQSGLNFWIGNFTPCGTNQQCLDVAGINVSASFFLSIEFQGTGYLVERLYKTAYGDAIGTSTAGGSHQLPVPIVRLNEFLSDSQEIGLGVVVGQGNWEQALENNKQAFTAEFVQRGRFTTAFPITLTPAQFVDTLNANAGNPLSPAERNQLVTDLTSNAKTRAQVLRAVAEDQDLVNTEFNRAFVLMQFLGYLRRNPNDAPDTDYSGYDFWLTKLNQFNGNFQNAEMVKAFISSTEYRHRFGP